MSGTDKWQGILQEKVDTISVDVKELKGGFQNHLKEHAKNLKETTTKWFWICISLLGGIFGLIIFILNSLK